MEIQEIKIIVKNYESKTLTFLTKEKQNKTRTHNPKRKANTNFSEFHENNANPSEKSWESQAHCKNKANP